MKSTLKTEYVASTAFASLEKELEGDVAAMQKTLEDATKKLEDQAKGNKKEIDAAIAKASVDTKKLLEASEAKTSKTVSDLMKGSSTVLTALKLTHWSNPKIPVYRWKMWDTHHHGISWFDGNNANGFAGAHPSQWTDGNRYVASLPNNWQYLSRLFNNKGVAHEYGATVCAFTYHMYSSTGGVLCGAIFRIKNTGTSTISWRPQMTMTS